MLARQMTAELQAIRNQMKHGEDADLVAKGIKFGKLTLTPKGIGTCRRSRG